MKPYLVLYIPVIHEGYIKLLDKYEIRVAGLYVVGESLAHEHIFLEKEIRAVKPETAAKIIRYIYNFPFVKILGIKKAASLRNARIITSNESITRQIARKYFKRPLVTYDHSFLRWDECHVDAKKPVVYDRVSKMAKDRAFMRIAREAASFSSDWWRRVGAVIPADPHLLAAHNEHLPSEYSQYSFGDIRDFIKSGTKSDVSSAIHAEKNIIAKAARRGISLEGKDIYVTVFPCSDCARVISSSGIRRCFFSKGHANFDGARVLKASGIELILVK